MKELLEFISPFLIVIMLMVIHDKTFYRWKNEGEDIMALIYCPECGERISDKAKMCIHCGYPLGEKENISAEKKNKIIVEEKQQQQEFDGIYRYTIFGKQAVYCPRCGSSECSHYYEQHVVPGKTKTTYTANINPFKPLTFANKKEKVVRRERLVTEKKIMCHKCGYVFY